MSSLTLAKMPKSKHKKQRKNKINANNILSKTIKNLFTAIFKTLWTTSSTSSDDVRRRYYECPCAHHKRQREADRRYHKNKPVKAKEPNRAMFDKNNTGIFLISSGVENQSAKEKNVTGEGANTLLSLSDAYAQVLKSQSMESEDDVDKKAERFIQNFWEQQRIERLLSLEASEVKKGGEVEDDVNQRAEKFIQLFRQQLKIHRALSQEACEDEMLDHARIQQ